jgi:DNA-binding response OmpR family regulator
MGNMLNILLIEDDADDIELLEEALRSNDVQYSMSSIMEGDKVGPYLLGGNSIPDVIVLDFNLPKLHGRDILKLIKAADDFKNVPLVVLSTSASGEDIAFATGLGANRYITKPTSISDFNKTVGIILSTAAGTSKDTDRHSAVESLFE